MIIALKAVVYKSLRKVRISGEKATNRKQAITNVISEAGDNVPEKKKA